MTLITQSPTSVRIEASSICQLKCPLCPTADGRVAKGRVGSGTLTLENFKKILKSNQTIKHIELSNYGEVFLNKELTDILKYAADNSIKISLKNGVNLNSVTREQLEALVKYSVDTISVSLDGVTQDTYQKYRIDGNLKRVLENIQTINGYKQAYDTDRPKLIWQFVLFSYNEHEINTAKKLAKKYNMTFYLKQNLSQSYFPVDNPKQEPEPFVVRSELKKQMDSLPIDGDFSPICAQLWVEPQINWDGSILGCCVNFKDDFGNVFDQSLTEIMNGKKYQDTLKMLSGYQFSPESPCINCSTFYNDFLPKYYIRYLIDAPLKWKIKLTKKYMRMLRKKQNLKKNL